MTDLPRFFTMIFPRLVLLLGWTMPVKAQIEIHTLTDLRNKDVDLKLDESYITTKIDSCGFASFEVPDTIQSRYASIHGPLGNITLYVAPKEKLTVVWTERGKASFKGESHAINDYLNDNFQYRLPIDNQVSDTAFVRQWERVYGQLVKHLEQAGLPDTFIASERVRLYYVAAYHLINYPMMHARLTGKSYYSPSEYYWMKLDSVMKENVRAYGFWEYRQAFRDWIKMKVDHSMPSSSQAGQLSNNIKYVQEHIHDVQLADYLLNDYLTYHIRHYGTDGVESYIERYDTMVRNLTYRNEFHTFCQRFTAIAQGKKAPEFILNDVTGKPISLYSLKGKYIYIDVWATWCMPCRREFPYLKLLERELRGRNIAFIGISIDKDLQAWKQYVGEGQLTGIQLYAGTGGSFNEQYKISAIPRFILIDPQGNILNAYMSRPSDPATLKTIRKHINH